jgi:outer membrane protein TolC
MQYNNCKQHRQATRRTFTRYATSGCVTVIAFLLVAYSSLATAAPARYNLEQAIAVALENNRLRTISQQSLAIAESQYRQAASSYWPTLSLNASITRRDEKPVFEYPEHTINAPPFPPLTVPAQEIEIMGRDSGLYSLDMTYPLYTGGKRSSMVEQAEIGVDIAAREIRRTNLQVVRDVKRYFYAALYTRQLVELAEDITLSFEVLQEITQALYEGGSNSVNKLDLLQSKLAHTMAQSALAELRSKHEAALSALSFSMGLDWREQIQLGAETYPATLDTKSLDYLIEQALSFNPEIEQLALAVESGGARIREAKSGYYPTLSLVGSYDRFHNDLNTGLDNKINRNSWMIGIALQANLFEGGLTRHKVSEAEAEQARMEQRRLLVSDAVATQVKNLFLKVKAARQQIDINQHSVEISRENRELTVRAYRTGAVDTENVIEANLFDAMVRANYFRSRHDQALYLAEISYLLGKEAVE